MPFGLPAIGETSWGQKVLDSINAVKVTADAKLPVFDVVAYGAAVDGVTDDTPAWQACIDAVATAGGGKIISSRSGVSIIAGALQDTGGANAQITLPSVDYVASEQITIVIEGPAPPPTIYSVIGDTPIPDNHLVLKSTLATGNGAVIGGFGPVGSQGGFTNVALQLRNLTVRTPANPTNTGLNLALVATADIDNITVDTGSYYIQGLTEPTTASSYGIRLPGNNNGAYTRLGAVNVVGFYTGYQFAEHTNGQQVAAWGCKRAFEFIGTNHASKFQRLMSVHCPVGMVFTGTHYVDVDQFNIEHAASGWWLPAADISDASNYGKGTVRWHSVLAGVGPENSFTKTGGAGIHAVRMGSDGDTGRRNITSLIPAATVTSYPNMLLYVRRIGSRVVYTIIDSADGVTGDVTLLEPAALPAGFSNPDLQVGAARIAVAPLFNNTTGYVAGSASTYFSTESGLRLLGAPGAAVVAQLTFDTTDAWPATLPGTA